MENPISIDDEGILVTHYNEDHENGYDDYNKPNTVRVYEITFAKASCTNKQLKSTLKLKEKVKQDKLTALNKHLDVKVDQDLIILDQFKLTADPIKGTK